jgi:hypothetical protein
VFLTGIFPTIFAVTGVIMWLRKRSTRKALENKGFDGEPGRTQLHAAE